MRARGAIALAGALLVGGTIVAAADVGASTPPTTEPAGTEPAATDSEWTAIDAPEDCMCADGAPYNFFERPADPATVVFFLEGGGACFTPESCAFTEESTTLYDWNIGADDDPATMAGIFDLENAENPFADYSFVYVPYCTGDVHLGNSAHEDSPDLTVEHRGWVNGNAAVSYLAEHYADAEQIVVVGESAGSIAAAAYAATIGDVLPDAQITVFADGSGGYPDNGQLSVGMEALWGFVRPDWAADVPIEEWTVPGMVEAAGAHNPDIVMSRFDYAFDGVQSAFLAVLGIDDPLLPVVDANEAMIEAAGVNQFSFTAPGSDHTLVRKQVFYEMELNGTRLVDWVTSIVNGETVEDVHCDECEGP